jgi:hypothetical protein
MFAANNETVLESRKDFGIIAGPKLLVNALASSHTKTHTKGGSFNHFKRPTKQHEGWA